jgi:putative spermidine/putrescine transport system substrate-binding protein
MNPKKFGLQLLPVLTIITMILSACSTPAAPTAPAATSAVAATSAPAATKAQAKVNWNTVKTVADGGGMDALVAAAKAEGELNVITLPRDWCNYGEMMDTFAKKYGIKVNSLNPDGGSADEVQAIKDNKDNKGPGCSGYWPGLRPALQRSEPARTLQGCHLEHHQGHQ